MTNTDIFNLTPDEFHQQDEAERRAEQERIEAKARAEREKAQAEALKKVEATVRRCTRWLRWMDHIGSASGLKYEVRQTGSEYRPGELIIDGIRVPVSEGSGTHFSLEINLPWYTAGYDNYRRRRFPAEKCSSKQKKDGSFNYEALGKMARRYVEAEKLHAREEAAKIGAASVVKQLATELGYNNLHPSTDPAKPVRFKFSIDRNMTEAEARAAHAALVLAGLIKEG